MRHRNGELIWVDLSGTALSEEESVWMLIDISGLKHSEAQAHHMALHDALTGLANRRSLDERLRGALAWARREQRAIALAYMDLDGFKSINDRHGHEAGDAVLRQVADRLAGRVRGHDLVARLGGDEFAIVLADTTSPEEVRTILDRCWLPSRCRWPCPMAPWCRWEAAWAWCSVPPRPTRRKPC
jgi:GGDEF domain-containing protein